MLLSLGAVQLNQNIFDDFPVNVGQAIVSALETIREFFVLDAKQVHDGGVQVINFDWFLCDVCLLYTSPSPRDRTRSRMPSSA